MSKTIEEYFKNIPYDDIVSLGQRTMLYMDLFNVTWHLGRFCNYRCSYCWPYARSHTKDHRPTELCLLTIDEIKRQARENGFNSFHFSMSGGEPTFHPGFHDIQHKLAEDVPNTNYSSFHMISNCSRPMSWFETFVEYAKPFHRVSITASFHDESNPDKKDWQEFADKLILCQKYDIHIIINIIMVPSTFERKWEEANFFYEQGLNVSLKPESDSSARNVVDGYTEDMMNKMKEGMPQKAYTEVKKEWMDRPKRKLKKLPIHSQEKIISNDIDIKKITVMQMEMKDSKGDYWYMDQAERFNAFDFNKFEGWNCNAGFQGIIIREPDGNIKRSFGCMDKPLGNIETGFKIFDSPKPCITPSCLSSADSKIPKRKYEK